MSYGLGQRLPDDPRGVSGNRQRNVIVGQGTILGPSPAAKAIEIGNIADATFTDNLFADGLSTGMPAFSLEAGQGVFNPTQAVGINDSDHHRQHGLQLGPRRFHRREHHPRTTGLYGLNDVTLSDNDFQDISRRSGRRGTWGR